MENQLRPLLSCGPCLPTREAWTPIRPPSPPPHPTSQDMSGSRLDHGTELHHACSGHRTSRCCHPAGLDQEDAHTRRHASHHTRHPAPAPRHADQCDLWRRRAQSQIISPVWIASLLCPAAQVAVPYPALGLLVLIAASSSSSSNCHVVSTARPRDHIEGGREQTDQDEEG
jgi:hypothetical protein